MAIFSDDEVIRSVISGRTRDFEILVERYKHRIVNFINKMIYDHDEAQNISQDVFLKVFETLKKYKMQDNFQAFLFTIAKNLTLNYIKKQKRITYFSSLLPRSGDAKHFSYEAGQENRIINQEDEALLLMGLRQLNENQRLALIMKIYLRWSYNRIAEVTGWSIPKLETLISRGRTNLVKFMQEKRKQGV